MRNVWVFFGAIFMIVGLIIFGNQFVLVIKDSVKHGLPIADILPIVGFKVLRDVPLILSLSLFLAIILAINNLYKHSEAAVMNAMGLGDKHFMVFISPIVLIIFIFVLFLTTNAVPWAKQQRGILIDSQKNSSEFSLIKTGKFQTFKDGNIVFYASDAKIDEASNEQIMYDVFIYTKTADEPIITLAKSAKKTTNPATGNTYLHLIEGRRYHGFPADVGKKILNFSAYDLQLSAGFAPVPAVLYDRIEYKSTWDLLNTKGLAASIELQWRLSQPLSILILSILGVLLGKTAPRGSKNLNALFGVIIFILYNNALLISKSALEKGDMPALLGLWWVHFLMILMVLILYAYRHKKFRKYYLRLRLTCTSRVK